MKYYYILLFFLNLNFLQSQIVDVSYECRSLFSSSFISKIEDMPDLQKQKLMNNFDGLLKHYTVKSDENKIIRTLDSISQKCGAEPVFLYTYKQILIKSEENWQQYFQMNGTSDLTFYKLSEPLQMDKWDIDYNSTKNILGQKCFYAKNLNSEDVWAWFTAEIPFLLTPKIILPLPGMVLEYKDESDHYIAKDVNINKSLKEDICLDENVTTTVSVKSFRAFADILMTEGLKISTNMFTCREVIKE